MKVEGVDRRTVWRNGPTVQMIDQIKLPHTFEIVDMANHQETAKAIKTMVVRGAGAIGATAGYAMAQAALEAPKDPAGFTAYYKRAAETVRKTRPTAQNLFYAIDRVSAAVTAALPNVTLAKDEACAVAQAIADEDAAACKQIGQLGASVIRRKDGQEGKIGVSTHCNAGWLAFVDWGSALSPIYTAHRNGKDIFVYVDETRPRGQGASLTAWELTQESVPCALIADCATGHFLSQGDIDVVIVGSDRIAANGDVANKIGTYSRAVVAHANNVPFYVAAPTSTIDINCISGDLIPIEERSQDEVLTARGLGPSGEIQQVQVSAAGVCARNPAFDVTPARYISGIITEVGIVAPTPEGIRWAYEKSRELKAAQA